MHHPNLDYMEQWIGELSQNHLCQIQGALKRPSWKERTYLLVFYRPFPVRRYNCRCAEGMPESFICYWPAHKGYIINNWCLQTELIYHEMACFNTQFIFSHFFVFHSFILKIVLKCNHFYSLMLNSSQIGRLPRSHCVLIGSSWSKTCWWLFIICYLLNKRKWPDVIMIFSINNFHVKMKVTRYFRNEMLSLSICSFGINKRLKSFTINAN